jgi:hypothetical protein
MYRRLAEDDKDGVMAEKVLRLFWSLAHSPDVTVEIMDQVCSNSCTGFRSIKLIQV